MMLSKKNSEALENFSEKLEVEGRSLWQDARRRFMHNRAAVASLVVLVLIALFVTLAPMLSQFTYFDTDWGMMSSAPDMESGHYFGTDSSGRDLLVRVAIGGKYLPDGWHRGGAGGGDRRHALRFAFRIPRRESGLRDDASARNPELLPVHVLRHSAGDLLWSKYPADLRGDRDGVWLDMARIVRGKTLSLKRKEFIEAAQVGGVSTANIVVRHIVPNVLGVVVVYASLLVPSMILFESFLSFWD